MRGFICDAANFRGTAPCGVTRAQVEQVFFSAPLLLLPDPGQGAGASRVHALGRAREGRRLQLVFSLRIPKQTVRVIAARDMHRKQRMIYDQASQAETGICD